MNLLHKTLDELRAVARTSGLRGYSGLRKNQLIELLKKHKARSSAAAPAPKKAAKSKPARAKTARKPPVAAENAPVAPAPVVTQFASVEEHIESAKFEMGPPGAVFAVAPTTSWLEENIERLPALGEAVLILLPQKPGVVHAYWVLQAGAAPKNLRLRLCHVADDAIELLEEIQIPGERGHWYFHIPTAADTGSFFAQLGHYDAAGNFVTAIRRGVARIPSLYASNRTDRRWWISDEEFRAMYLRAGGVMRAGRLAWTEATGSSPGGAPSSRQK